MASDDRFRAYGRRVSSGGRPSTTSSRPTRTSSGGGGGRPHGGGGGQDRSNAIADKINREREQKKKDKAISIQEQINLAKKLKSQGVTSDQLTNEEKRQLSDLQFMQDEGVYGGVSGNEAEINKMKKAIVEGGAGYKEALAGLARLSGGNEELAKISALGVQEYLNRKSKGNPKTMSDIITGKTPIEGLSPDFFKNFVYGGDDPDKSKQVGTAGLRLGEDPLGTYISGDALGYDPTGAYTWSDIESDPDLYNKYLNRGTLWDDPLSGTFDPTVEIHHGEPGGGGWGGGYGGGDDGGLGWMLPRPGQRPEQMAGFYTPQANLQQAMINVHNVPTGFQMKRGGIVSLLRLS